MSLDAPLKYQTACSKVAEAQDAVGSNGSQSRVTCRQCGKNLYHKHVGLSDRHLGRLRANEDLIGVFITSASVKSWRRPSEASSARTQHRGDSRVDRTVELEALREDRRAL